MNKNILAIVFAFSFFNTLSAMDIEKTLKCGLYGANAISFILDQTIDYDLKNIMHAKPHFKPALERHSKKHFINYMTPLCNACAINSTVQSKYGFACLFTTLAIKNVHMRANEIDTTLSLLKGRGNRIN